RVPATLEPGGLASGGHDALYRPRRGLRVRAAAAELPEAAVAVLRLAEERHGAPRDLRPPHPGRGKRLQDATGVVHVARRARPEAEAAVAVVPLREPARRVLDARAAGGLEGEDAERRPAVVRLPRPVPRAPPLDRGHEVATRE